MPEITLQIIQEYRARTFHILPELQVKNADQAVEFVNERSFVFFWPIKGILCPSLWVATAGDRPVPNDHDDPGQITWTWKDDLLDKKRWYYARLLRRRNMMISLDVLPFFYALSPNYGDPENDFLDQYHQGQLTMECKNLYEMLLQEGPLDTLELRKKAHLSSTENNTRFNKAMDDLQGEFKILPVGVAAVGRWHYAFIYDLTSRHFPTLVEQAGPIREQDARKKLVELYLSSVGAAPLPDIQKLFGWRPEDTRRTIERLKEENILSEISIEGNSETWLSGNALLSC